MYEPYTGDGVTAWMLTSPPDADILTILTRTATHQGTFREPITLDPGTRRVVDGTHRLIAAHLAQAATVPVINAADITVTPDAPHPYIEIQFTTDSPLTDTDIDNAVMSLRSFPLSGTVWLTDGTFARIDGTYHTSWDTAPEHASDVLTAATTRLRAIGIHPATITVNTTTY